VKQFILSPPLASASRQNIAPSGQEVEDDWHWMPLMLAASMAHGS